MHTDKNIHEKSVKKAVWGIFAVERNYFYEFDEKRALVCTYVFRFFGIPVYSFRERDPRY